ncbi:MAG: redoxin domain-containing protein [Polyangiaceae bacterium]
MFRRFLILLAGSGAVLACSSQPLNEAGAGGDSAGGSAATLGSGGAVGANGGSGAGGAALPSLSRADYPSGPYGHGVGAVIPNLSFLGWRKPADSNYDVAKLEVVSLSDFYNPNGTAGAPRILALNASAVWCTVCRAEYRQFQTSNTYDTYRPKGVEMLGLLFQDNNYGPAKPADLARWGGDTGFSVKFPLALDPSFKIGQFFASDATPLNLLIDTSDMRILKVTMGYDSSDPQAYWTAIEKWLAQ